MADPTLTAGLLASAGTLTTGLLALAGLLARRHIGLIDKLEDNDTKKTEHIGRLATSIEATQRATAEHAARLSELEATIEDRRMSEATAELKATREALTTGQHTAVTVEIPEAQPVGPHRVRPVSAPDFRGRR